MELNHHCRWSLSLSVLCRREEKRKLVFVVRKVSNSLESMTAVLALNGSVRLGHDQRFDHGTYGRSRGGRRLAFLYLVNLYLGP